MCWAWHQPSLQPGGNGLLRCYARALILKMGTGAMGYQQFMGNMMMKPWGFWVKHMGNVPLICWESWWVGGDWMQRFQGPPKTCGGWSLGWIYCALHPAFTNVGFAGEKTWEIQQESDLFCHEFTWFLWKIQASRCTWTERAVANVAIWQCL